MSFADLLASLDRVLQDEGIPYAVIGGYGVAAWGRIRATRDLDLLVEPPNIEILEKALTRAGFPIEIRRGDTADPIACVIRVADEIRTLSYEIDLLIGIRGTPDGLMSRVRRLEFSRLTVPVASPEDMIVLKLVAGSTLDMEDARNILQTQAEKISKDLLEALTPPHLLETLHHLYSQS